MKNNYVETCPHCGTSLRGAPVPLKQRTSKTTHYTRKILEKSIDGKYMAWKCPDCKRTWEVK